MKKFFGVGRRFFPGAEAWGRNKKREAVGGGIASAVLGKFADTYGIEAIYNFCAYMPLIGIVACLLPNLKNRELPK